MKRLSDYNVDEAFDLMDKFSEDIAILTSNEGIIAIAKDKKLTDEEKMKKNVSYLFKNYKEELKRVLMAIDQTPINGANLYLRTMQFLSDINSGGDANFSESPEQK